MTLRILSDVPGKPVIYTARDGKSREKRARCRHCGRIAPLRVVKDHNNAPILLLMGFFTMGIAWLCAFIPNETWRCVTCGRKY